MTMPGFSAESSLYEAAVNYRSKAIAAQIVGGAVPQLLDPPGTVCGPCVGGVQHCYSCWDWQFSGRCHFWTQRCDFAPR
jgi:hypothetical protein